MIEVVAAAMWQRMGYSGPVVDNGQLTLGAVQCEKSDAVLMDVQMPVVDDADIERRRSTLAGTSHHDWESQSKRGNCLTVRKGISTFLA